MFLALQLQLGILSFKSGLNNVFSNQFGISVPPQSFITPDKFYWDILCSLSHLHLLFRKKICNAVLLWSFGNVAQGHHLAQLVQWASHEQRLCPHCSAPMFKSRPGVLCCVSLPRSLILFPVMSQYVLSIKSYQDHKTFFFFLLLFLKKCYSVYKTRLSTGMGIGR